MNQGDPKKPLNQEWKMRGKRNRRNSERGMEG